MDKKREKMLRETREKHRKFEEFSRAYLFDFYLPLHLEIDAKMVSINADINGEKIKISTDLSPIKDYDPFDHCHPISDIFSMIFARIIEDILKTAFHKLEKEQKNDE